MDCFSHPLDTASDSLLPDFSLFPRRLGRFFSDWKSSLVGLHSSLPPPTLLLLLLEGFFSAECGSCPKLHRRVTWWARCCGGVKVRGWRIDEVPLKRADVAFSLRNDMWYFRLSYISPPYKMSAICTQVGVDWNRVRAPLSACCGKIIVELNIFFSRECQPIYR